VNKSFITDKCNSAEGTRLDYKIFVNFAFELAKNCKGLLYLAEQHRPPLLLLRTKSMIVYWDMRVLI